MAILRHARYICFTALSVVACASWAGPIHDAAKAGNLNALQMLVAQSVDPRKAINEQDDKGRSALHWAVAEGKIELVPWLLKNGADVTLRTKDQKTPLLLAGEYGRPQTAIYLIQAGASVSDMASLRIDSSSPYFAYNSELQVSAVSLAAMNGHPEVIKVLLDRGADVNGVKDEYARDSGSPDAYHSPLPMEFAVRNNHREIIKLLLDRGSQLGFALHAVIQNKNRGMLDYLFGLGVKPDVMAIFYASQQGDRELIDYLIKNGAVVHQNALVHVARENNEALLKYLLAHTSQSTFVYFLRALSHEANVYYGGNIPNLVIMRLLLDHDPVAVRKEPVLLHAAATQGATDVVDLLLARGFSVQARDNFGNTALHWAAQQGHPDTVRLLLERGADITARSERGNTSLHRVIAGSYRYATDKQPNTASSDQLEVVKLLLGRKVNVNVRNDAGNTALHMAALRGYSEVVQLLLQSGAQANVRNEQGLEPVHAAAANGNPRLMKALLDSGANPAATSNVGTTPLHHALSGKFSFYQGGSSWMWKGHDTRSVAATDRLALLRLLIGHKVDVNARSEHFATPLHIAVWGGYQVSGRNFSANYVNYGGPFPTVKGQMLAIELLLQAGASMYVRDNSEPSLTVLDVARHVRDRQQIVDLLVAEGKKPGVMGPGGLIIRKIP